MRRGLVLSRLGAMLAGLALASFALAAPEPPPVAKADGVVLEQVLRESGVVTTPSQPGLPRYVQDLSTAVGMTVARWLSGALPGFAAWVGSFARVTVWGLFAVVLGLAGLVAARWLKARRGAGSEAAASVADRASALRPADPEPDWRLELERRLAAGTAREALEALWHWLARRLVDGPVEASWTSRELVHSAGREDLLPAVRRLDRLLYSAAIPGEDDVRRLWRDLREAA